MPETTHPKIDTNSATLGYILNKFSLSFDDKTPMPIEIPDFGRNQLPALFKELGYGVGAEIGVYLGEYSELLCKDNPGLELYGIDPYKAYSAYTQQQLDSALVEAKTRLTPYNFKFIYKPSLDAVKDFADNALDFVYIDGAHDFYNASADITSWSPKVRTGGIISGHDYIKIKRQEHQVVQAVRSYAHANNISPWFVLGHNGKIPGMIRDHHRSWMWVKL